MADHAEHSRAFSIKTTPEQAAHMRLLGAACSEVRALARGYVDSAMAAGASLQQAAMGLGKRLRQQHRRSSLFGAIPVGYLLDAGRHVVGARQAEAEGLEPRPELNGFGMEPRSITEHYMPAPPGLAAALVRVPKLGWFWVEGEVPPQAAVHRMEFRDDMAGEWQVVLYWRA